MDSVDGRGVNWAHPMNNSTHLPPKSPHGRSSSYSMFSSGSLFDCGGHRRSPSAGYIPNPPPPPPQPQGHPTWLSDRLGSPDVVLKKCSHRRSSSDSVAFVDTSYQYMNYLEHVTEEEEFVLQEAQVLPPPPPPLLPSSSYRPTHRRFMSADHGRDDYSFQYELPTSHHRSYPEKSTRGGGDCRFLRDSEPFQWQQQQQPRQENIAAAYNNNNNNSRVSGNNLEKFQGSVEEDRGGFKAKKLVVAALALANHSKSDNFLLASRGGGGGRSVPVPPPSGSSFENRSTASESNSHSDDSNDDNNNNNMSRASNKSCNSSERFRNCDNSEARSDDGGGGCTSSDQVDPKKAKRILANRQSAQRSRVRKLQYISELEMNVSLLEAEVASLSPKVAYFDHERVLLSAENALLKQNLAALAKTQRRKEAYNETLKTEVQRLRQICNQQYSPQQQQQPLSPDSVELQLLRFSKLDLGPPNIPKPKSPTAYPGGSGSGRISTGKPSLYPTTISPTHARNNNNNNNVNATRSSSRGGGQSLMMGTSFMVAHNST